MNIREEIIKQLDRPVEYENVKLSEVSLLKDMQYGAGFSYENRYKKLKDCLHLLVSNNRDDLDLWFKGVIHSLYYRPNKYVLVLEGEQAIGKTTFFYNFLWDKTLKSLGYNGEKTDVFESLIIHYDESMNKRELNLSLQEDFKVRYPYTHQAVADKRLASYCCSTNHWQHPQRKNFIVLKLESINQELFNSIDKLQLWIEIFNKFKPEGK